MVFHVWRTLSFVTRYCCSMCFCFVCRACFFCLSRFLLLWLCWITSVFLTVFFLYVLESFCPTNPASVLCWPHYSSWCRGLNHVGFPSMLLLFLLSCSFPVWFGIAASDDQLVVVKFVFVVVWLLLMCTLCCSLHQHRVTQCNTVVQSRCYLCLGLCLFCRYCVVDTCLVDSYVSHCLAVVTAVAILQLFILRTTLLQWDAPPNATRLCDTVTLYLFVRLMSWYSTSVDFDLNYILTRVFVWLPSM